MEKCKISDLKIGQSAKVLSINIPNKQIKRHMLDMGITRDVVVTVKKIAPMGDPISIELRGYELVIRKADLEQIEVEVLK